MFVAIVLMIFFGAWAVSVSDRSDFGNILAGATSGFSGSISAETAGSAAAGSDSVPRLATAPDGSPAASDTWWGKALLGACPLH